MKIHALYRPNSEMARKIEDYVRDFEKSRGVKIELVSLETRDGATMASLYDITQYPAILVVREDGQLLKNWVGDQLPLMNEVASFSYS